MGSAALGLQGIRKQPANGRAFLGDSSDLTDLNEVGFGQINGDFHKMKVSQSDFLSSNVRYFREKFMIPSEASPQTPETRDQRPETRQKIKDRRRKT
jgi:hypothetical protein